MSEFAMKSMRKIIMNLSKVNVLLMIITMSNECEHKNDSLAAHLNDICQLMKYLINDLKEKVN